MKAVAGGEVVARDTDVRVTFEKHGVSLCYLTRSTTDAAN